MALRNILSSVKRTLKAVPSVKSLASRAIATSVPKQAASPVYELRMYSFHPSHFKTACELYNKHHALRTQFSKLTGFWNAEVGGGVTQLVHIWEYDSLSHRRNVRTEMAGNQVWNTEFLPTLLPCLTDWKNALMVNSPGSQLNTHFDKDPSAVYLLETSNVPNYNDLPELKEAKKGEVLVGRFCGILGQTKAEYRLWRYADIDQATDASQQRAVEAPFSGSSMLLYPSKFSPLQ